MLQRAYCHAGRCLHCGSNRMPKAGFSRGEQTYCCGECQRRRPGPEGNRHGHSPQVKGQAREMYGDGISLAALSRALELPELTVDPWIK